MIFDKRVTIYVDGACYDPSYRWCKRIRKAHRRAEGNRTLRAMVKALKPANTPLQIADAKTSA